MDKGLLLRRIGYEMTFMGGVSQRTKGFILREAGDTHNYCPRYNILSKQRECWCKLPFNSACHFPDQKLPEVEDG